MLMHNLNSYYEWLVTFDHFMRGSILEVFNIYNNFKQVPCLPFHPFYIYVWSTISNVDLNQTQNWRFSVQEHVTRSDLIKSTTGRITNCIYSRFWSKSKFVFLISK